MLLAALLSFVRSYIQSWRYPVHVILVESTYNVQFKLPRNYQNYLCELPRTKRAELTRIYNSANYLCVLPRIIFRRITEPYWVNQEFASSIDRVKRIWRVPVLLQWFLIRLYIQVTNDPSTSSIVCDVWPRS